MAEMNQAKPARVRRVRHRGRESQVLIYLGKQLRFFINQSDWKVLPMAAIIAALVSMVIRNKIFVTMEGDLLGAFALTCVCIWNGCFNSIQAVCRERPIVKREHRSGLHISAYVTAHMIYQLALCAAQTGLTLYVLQTMGVVFPEKGIMTRYMLVDLAISMLLITYASDMLSLFLSSISHTTTGAMTLMPFVLIFQLVFSGGLIPLPEWSQALSDYTISSYGIRVLASQAGYNDLPMVTGWETLDKKTYYFAPDGKMQTGWKTIKGKKYYFSRKGVMQTGWKQLKKKWYRFNKKTGAVMTGWKTLAGSRYYFNSDGAMSVGWKTIDGANYYFYEKETKKHALGAMAVSTTINGRKIGKNGKEIETFSDADEKAMYKKAQGYSSPTDYLVLANVSTHRVGVYRWGNGKWNRAKYYTVTTGAPNMPTREGVFYRGMKLLYFNSGSDRCWYATQYSGNYLFHSVLYTQESSPNTITDGRIGVSASHGCIRMKLEEAKWIYDNIPASTKIVVYH